MKIRKLISGIIASLFLANFAIADTSTNYKIDISDLNAVGSFSQSANYKENGAVIGFVDGNMANSPAFTLGSGLPYLELLCGNGIHEFGEQCDDGNLTNGDGCNSICKTEVGAVCGNGALEAGEGCDDGNLVSGDGCDSTCHFEVCGNGLVQTGEQCDDGNLNNGDGCSSVCMTETVGGGYVTPYSYHACGNGRVEMDEQCDDGNRTSGDGCSNSCKLEPAHPVAPEKPPIQPGQPENPAVQPDQTGEQPAEVIPEELPGMGVPREIKIKAHPEKRVHPENNLSNPGRLVFYNTTLNKKVLVVNIGMNDIGWSLLDSNKLPDGVYDIAYKGISHLTKIIRNVKIDSTTKTLDFTDSESFYLVAGDVNQSKDDFINGLDIAADIDLLYTSDINGDLNRDGIVNGLDVSIVVSNIYKRGEKLIM
jgi:cysteine-rich repeat protein